MQHLILHPGMKEWSLQSYKAYQGLFNSHLWGKTSKNLNLNFYNPTFCTNSAEDLHQICGFLPSFKILSLLKITEFQQKVDESLIFTEGLENVCGIKERKDRRIFLLV